MIFGLKYQVFTRKNWDIIVKSLIPGVDCEIFSKTKGLSNTLCGSMYNFIFYGDSKVILIGDVRNVVM
jgi:hypothetical protein